MKKKIWVKILIAFLCVYALGVIISDNKEPKTEVEVETTAAVETAVPTETVAFVEETEPKETTDAERVGVTEIELREILHAIRDYNLAYDCDYELEDIDLIRKDNDVFVEFEEYIVFMKNGEVLRTNIKKSLIDVEN